MKLDSLMSSASTQTFSRIIRLYCSLRLDAFMIENSKIFYFAVGNYNNCTFAYGI